MDTQNTSGMLSVARIALLASVSAAALSLSMGAAQADDLTIFGNPPPSLLVSVPGVAMLQLNGINNQTAQIGSTFNTSVDGTTTEAGFKTTDFTSGNSVSITPNTGLQIGNFNTQAVTASINPDGSASFASGTTTIGSSGNLTVGGSTFTNGITNTGNTTTDTLTVNKGASFAGGATMIDGTTGNLTVTDGLGNTALVSTTVMGLGAANGTGAGVGIAGNGNAYLATFAGPGLTNQTFGVDSGTGNMFTAGTATIGGLLTANGGAVVNGGLGVTGGSWIDGGSTFTNIANNTPGSTYINGGILTVNGGTPGQSITLDANADPVLTVTNGTAAGTTTIHNGIVTAGTSVNAPTVNAVTVNTANANIGNSLAVAPGATVDMGGNRVMDVGAPIAPTDAANKAYVDAGLNAANQRIDKANQGIAIAMSVQNPVLTNGDRFGVSVNWGDFAGNNAVGASAVGIVAHNLFGHDNLGITGGFGVSNNQVAGRAGVQLTW